MDFDNFDFKPLTTGLGFDKKAEQTKVPQQTSAKAPSMVETSKDTLADIAKPVMSAPLSSHKESKSHKPDLFERSLEKESKLESSKTIQDMLSALPPSLDFVENKKEKAITRNYTPVGRQDYITPAYDKPKVDLNTEIPTDMGREGVDISLDNTLEKAFPKVGFRKPFFHQTVEIKPQYSPVNTSVTSAVIDALVILGLTALFLVSLVVFTKIDLIAVLLRTDAPMSVWLEVSAIFVGVYLLYYLCTRGFWGSTLGDWAFDIQLGVEEDRMNWYYPALLVFRMLIVALTGFIVLPIISLLVQKDVAGKMTGLHLYSKNY